MDSKRPDSLTDWTNNPFERVNHSTNFEDYAITTETNSMYDRQNHSETNISSKVKENDKRDPMSNTFTKIYLKPHKFEPTIAAPKFSMDQRDNGFVDSGHSSAEVTPAGTPQSSPYSIRKMLDMNKIGNSANTTNTTNNNNNQKVSSNTKRWFYTGFFGSDDKTGVGNSVPKNPSLKNLCISNFDINAVGPTSW